MKERFSKLGALVMCMVVAMMMVVGCSSDGDEKATKAAKVKVTFVNGESQLGVIEIEKGKSVSKGDYEKFESQEGMEFLGWFGTPTYLDASKKDMTKDVFEEDTTIYGCFKANEVKEDTRKWYIVGESSNGKLSTSSWAGSDVTDEARAELELKSTGNAVNEFQITIDLFEGDLAQVISDWTWDNQKGFGCITECDESQIIDGGGLAGDTKKNNMKVAVEGNYTITLTTNPENDALDTIKIVRNGDVTK